MREGQPLSYLGLGSLTVKGRIGNIHNMKLLRRTALFLVVFDLVTLCMFHLTYVPTSHFCPSLVWFFRLRHVSPFTLLVLEEEFLPLFGHWTGPS